MDRRGFLGTSLAAAGLQAVHSAPARSEDAARESKPLLAGSPVVSGPAPETLTILQAIGQPATGFLEYAVGDGPFARVDADSGGLLPYEEHVLKFRLPPLPAGKPIRYRVTAQPIEWVPVRQFVHGKIVAGETVAGPEHAFRTLDPAATETRFAVWNDTHENSETLSKLAALTAEYRPDFLLWNGDQTNDVHYPADIAGQVITPGGVELAANRPLAYARGNHDLRGPAARHIPQFTGTPDDRFYYGFRSGPLAVLVMDTGEDKPDDHPVLGGLAAFAKFRERQREWLAATVREAWFREAPFRVMFCHIPLWWIRHRTDIDYWEYSQVCRDAWTPLLAEAGVQLVVSGHTHNDAWMPAGKDQPLGQLIGGGPQPSSARFITGHATPHRLTIRMQKLDGEVVEELEFKA